MALFVTPVTQVHAGVSGGRRWLRRLPILVAIALIGGCSATARQYDIHNRVLSCEQANRLAYESLEDMNFTVIRFDLAAVRQPGLLRAVRQRGGEEQKVTVHVACDGTVADIEADEEGCFSDSVELKRAFEVTFTALARRAAAGEEETAGLVVHLRPVRGLSAKLDFGLDMASAGVLPVEVTVENRTSRAYVFDPADVVLLRSDGRRTQSLPLDDIVYKIVWAQEGTEATGITALVQRHMLVGRAVVNANQRLQGFLFYPLATYTEGRARVEEEESGESEGVIVRFH